MQASTLTAVAYRRLLFAAPLLLVLLSAAAPPKPAPPPTSAELARRLEQLAHRLGRVESLLGKPFGAELTAGTVLERLARVERTTQQLERTRPLARGTTSGANDASVLRRRLDDTVRQLERLRRETERTLGDLQRELRNARRQSGQIRDLRRDVERLGRDLESLERRVARLERP